MRVTAKPSDHGIQTLAVFEYPESMGFTSEYNSEFAAVRDFAKAFQHSQLVVKPSLEMGEDDVKKVEEMFQAPNITLNVQNVILSRKELLLCTVVGIVLQALVLAFPAAATYYWKWPRKGTAVPDYAYGLFAAGSVAIIVGVFGCSHIIEGSTTEHTFEPGGKGRLPELLRDTRVQRIICLQTACTVNSQHFPACVILHDPKTPTIRSSLLNDKNYRLVTIPKLICYTWS